MIDMYMRDCVYAMIKVCLLNTVYTWSVLILADEETTILGHIWLVSQTLYL